MDGFERGAATSVRCDAAGGREGGSLGDSAPMRMLEGQLARVARSRATVLLTGETGTGKGHAARHLHARSPERDAPFVHVDCASLSASVIESELFGHERGAFTGAHERRVGRFERAGEGTILLDEVAEVAPEIQAKLLRVLQEREFERVGGAAVLPVRARVVAATNRDLHREIAAGRFRADLFYRLQVFELRIPPLRERLEDVPRLVAQALARGAMRGAPVIRATEGFCARLQQHAWPGNVRELLNVLERVGISNPDGPWDAPDAELALAASTARVAAPSGEAAHVDPVPVDSRTGFDASERVELARALSSHRWNVSAAARSLGLSRGALRGRMARLGLQ